MNDLTKYTKIGILGGTFDPIHNGHLEMAHYALKQEGLDKILFIPTGKSYMKESTTDRETRYKMVELAISGKEDFLVSDMEIKREGNTYTYETLSTLKETYPNLEIYFIMGADSLFSVEKWFHSELIFDKCILLAASRGERSKEELYSKKEYLEERFHARVSILEMPPMDISSTLIREMCKEQKDCSELLPKAVKEFILLNNLYH